MSNFSYDDFAVLIRSFELGMLSSDSLRIVPLSAAPSMADAIRGNLDLSEGNAYLPHEKNGAKVVSNVTVQHQSDGYCRLVGHLELGFELDGDGNPVPETPFKAQAFVLYEGNEDKVIAVASLKEGFEIGGGCYPSFTITTVNNYQSVAFNPNAFATMEDLKNINGLDGLHIAFDQTTGDIKLLDKDGNVIDQANLPIKADVIIADGEEGYKYVKTDIQQDIHAAKAWMPEGSTAWESVDEVKYAMQQAALVVKSAGDASTGDVVGIAIQDQDPEASNPKMYTIAEGGATVKSVSGDDVPWLAAQDDLPADSTLRYGLEAFVWTVKDPDAVTQGSFFAKLNDSLLDLGFHEGDDIALGTNLEALAAYVGNTLDAEEYMHGEYAADRAEEVAEQRKLAKAELVEWNKQHPALTHNSTAGTRISSDGVDIRSGKLSIGDGPESGSDSVQHYELSTSFSEYTDKRDSGLVLSVLDASGGTTRDVLTISDYSYISGAPICMAMLEITDVNGLQFTPKRRTACFDCEMEEPSGLGTVNLKIKDNRPNSKGFIDEVFRDGCIVEISPVYISGGTAPEMLPSLNTVNTVATVSEDAVTELNCTCPQIIDWANSVNLGADGVRLFAIVKVY